MEDQDTIGVWADETFGPCKSDETLCIRANTEMAELLAKCGRPEIDSRELIGEAADVVICLMRLAYIHNYDLLHEVDVKMAINRKRQWKLDGRGHGQHVEIEQPEG